MPQAPTARAAAPSRGSHQHTVAARVLRRALRLGATALLLSGAPALLLPAPARAQTYGNVGSSVTVDYGVLDSLGGAPAGNLPGMLSNSYPPATPYGYAAPYGAPYGQGIYGQGAGGQLLAPPASTPRSTLTVGQPALPGAAAPGGEQAIRLIPPSQLKRSPAAAPAPAPTPTPAPAPTQQAVAEPTPPPPPTPIEETPAATPPTVPTPEPPAMAQTAPAAPEPPAAVPAPAPAPAQQAAVEPPPPPPPPTPDAAPEPAATPEAPAETAGPGAAAEMFPPAGDAEADEPSDSAAEAPEAAAAPEPEAPAPETPAADAPAAEQSLAEAGAATAEAAGEDAQVAALPPQAAVEGQVSIGFPEGGSELSAEARSELDGVAERLRGDEAMRVQLLAYAQAIDDNTSRARRMSLSRALAVRAYLIEKGVRSTRMDVRALGSNVEGEPADRVDIIPQAQ